MKHTAALLLLSCALLSCTAQSDLGALNPDCDPLMPSQCGLPWPSNLYLASDATRVTGYTLTFGPTTLPANISGAHVDPSAYKRLDGYSVGTPVITVFPNIDISGLATEDQIDQSLAADAPILLFQVSPTANQAVRRVPYFVELDVYQSDPSKQALLLHPAEILEEATRYVIAFRNIKDKGGAPFPRSPAFQLLIDGNTGNIDALKARQARFEQTFQLLEAQGVPRATLTLAWDFNTASGSAYHDDMLHMRDDALSAIGGASQGPAFTVTTVSSYTVQQDANIALQIQGTVDLPNYLIPKDFGGFTGSQINRDAKGVPQRMGTHTLPFWLMVPQSAVGGQPAGLVLYGHGLLGQGSEALSDYNRVIANQYNLIYFATDLTGLASGDVTAVLSILPDLGRFVSLTDRLQQGIVDWVVFARAMHQQAATLSALVKLGVQIDPKQLFYSGISQGGIFGATFMAMTPDMTVGHLGVPGNNYSLLLQRSRDFTSYLQLIQSQYQDPTDQDMLLGLMSLLWDATDPVTHLRHVTAQPYAGSKGPHYVLLGPARGDQQVAVVTNEILARTADIQIPLMEHYDTLRQPALTTPANYPRTASGIVLWDFGNPWPAPGNQPPSIVVPNGKACKQESDCPKAQQCDTTGSMLCVWLDPHESPRRNDDHNRQMDFFFRTGQIIDVCNGAPCTP